MSAEDYPSCDEEAAWGPQRHRRYAPKRESAPRGYWRSAEGLVAFVDMDHAHLLNTIAYVERRFRELQDSFCDGALDINLIYPEHAGLVAEAKRRNLIPRSAGKDGMVTRG